MDNVQNNRAAMQEMKLFWIKSHKCGEKIIVAYSKVYF
jgi:hypothetical protein